MRYLFYFVSVVAVMGCMNSDPIEDNMRRFTFAAFNSSADSLLFQVIKSDTEVLDLLEKSGVVNFNYCTFDSISYLVLDMKTSFNLNSTKELFEDLSEVHPQLLVLNKIITGKYELLNRIYKLEQKNSYQASEGQLIPMQKEEFARYVLTLEIINDSALVRDYVAVHDIGKAWPEITQNMKTVGIHEMELYLIGYRAFLIMDTKPNFDWNTDGNKWGELPREKEWQAYVAKFQKTNPESNAAEKWKTMRMISIYP